MPFSGSFNILSTSWMVNIIEFTSSKAPKTPSGGSFDRNNNNNSIFKLFLFAHSSGRQYVLDAYCLLALQITVSFFSSFIHFIIPSHCSLSILFFYFVAIYLPEHWLLVTIVRGLYISSLIFMELLCFDSLMRAMEVSAELGMSWIFQLGFNCWEPMFEKVFSLPIYFPEFSPSALLLSETVTSKRN